MDSFESWYQDTLKGPITVLEQERRALAKRLGLTWGGLGLLTLAVLEGVRRSPLIETMDLGDMAKGLTLAGLALSSAGGALSVKLTADYRHRFKAKILPPVLGTLSEDLRYRAGGAIPQRNFEAAGFFPGRRIKEFSGEDLIIGEVDGHALAMCEVHATWAVAFSKRDAITSGWFFEAPSAHDVSSRVLLVSKNFKMVQAFWAKKEHRDPELDFSADADFSAAYRVYARDEAAARALLTPEWRRTLATLKHEVEAPMLLAFADEKLYGLFPSSEKFLEPPVFRSLKQAGQLREHLAVIHMAVEMVRALGRGQGHARPSA